MSRETEIAAQVADALDRAIAHIRRAGWFQGMYYDRQQYENGTPLEECRVCALGAISVAVYGVPVPTLGAKDEDQLIYTHAWDAVSLVVARVARSAFSVPDFNDADERTVQDVIGALGIAAAQLRSGAFTIRTD